MHTEKVSKWVFRDLETAATKRDHLQTHKLIAVLKYAHEQYRELQCDADSLQEATLQIVIQLTAAMQHCGLLMQKKCQQGVTKILNWYKDGGIHRDCSDPRKVLCDTLELAIELLSDMDVCPCGY